MHDHRPDRRALSGSAPPASTVLRIPLRGTRLRRAVDPGASAVPAGLTARARPKARPRNAWRTPTCNDASDSRNSRHEDLIPRCGPLRNPPSGLISVFRICWSLVAVTTTGKICQAMSGRRWRSRRRLRRSGVATRPSAFPANRLGLDVTLHTAGRLGVEKGSIRPLGGRERERG
jgi:hypothetical protein